MDRRIALYNMSSLLKSLEELVNIDIEAPDIEVCDFFKAQEIYHDQMKILFGDLPKIAEMKSYELKEELCDYDPTTHLILVSDNWDGEAKPLLEALTYGLQAQELSKVEKVNNLFSHYFGMHVDVQKTIAQEIVFNGFRTYVTNILIGYTPVPEDNLAQFGFDILALIDCDQEKLLGSQHLEMVGLNYINSVIETGLPYTEILSCVPETLTELILFNCEERWAN